MNACPRLETDRLILRPFIDGDVDDYFAVLDTAEVRQALHLSESLDRSDAWQQMAWFLGRWALRGTEHWALEERSSGRFVGRRPSLSRTSGWLGVEDQLGTSP